MIYLNNIWFQLVKETDKPHERVSLPSTIMQGRPWRLPLTLMLTLALGVYLGINWMMIWNIIDGALIRSPSKSLAQVAILLFGFYSAVFGGLAVRGPLRWIFVAAFVVSISCNLSAFVIIGNTPTRATGVWLFSEIGQFGSLLRVWGFVIAGVLFLTLIVVLTLTWLAHQICNAIEVKLPTKLAKRLQWIAIAGVLVLPMAGGLSQARMGLAESNVYAFAIVSYRVGSPKAKDVPYAPATLPAARKIVLVIDESTRADTFAEVVRPAIRWPSLVDYGVGYSNANCSSASNFMLRFGIEPGRLGNAHDPRTQASLWAFAKQAGFRTVLIDGQLSDSNKSQNFIGANERALIDDYIAADIGVTTDVSIAQQLTERFRTPQQELIMIIKRGNHFPYAANIPPEDRQSDRTLKESYRSLVEYTTRNFFDLLWAEHKQLGEVLLFFTSDHGQYHGPGSTHCREDKLDDEYEVPIVVMGGASTYLDRLAAARECWMGGAHHQAMRSTVIEALGYSADDIASHLYPPLTVCTAHQSIPRYLGYTPFPTSTNEVLEFTLVPFRK